MMSFAQLYTRTVSKSALSRAAKVVARAGAQREAVAALSAQELQDQFQALANVPLAARQEKGLALVREAASRARGTPHFDVQLQGGLVLLQRKLAEMHTGEGKTLTITVPAAILALERRGVHVVTANEYLAQRDADLMRPVYEALGLTVGTTLSSGTVAEKLAAYQCDVTYGVGSEFGFDYLKDNLVVRAEDAVQRERFAAIVDEVDSILIDEARVPLIIAESSGDVSHIVGTLNRCVRALTPDTHFVVDLKERTADLTEDGYRAVESSLVTVGAFESEDALYRAENLIWVGLLHSTVKAYALFRRVRDYVVENGTIALVDPSTGRSMPDRRLSDGLHEALEAREGLEVKRGTDTRATITYQSYFGLYEHLCGLTGTAATDAAEFSEIYGLETVSVPTNRPNIRKQSEDLVYLSKKDKFQAAVELAAARQAAGQPVLIGCASIRDAEALDRMLTRQGVAHATLTAKHIESEAKIIAEAGRPGSVTVATNMAGRGTDIILGGVEPNAAAFASTADFDTAHAQWVVARDAAMAAGGLFVLGTERNGLRRVDNQLAGRSGRQGNPGEVQFLLSLEDELLRTFGKSKQLAFLHSILEKSGAALGGAQVARMVTMAQEGVEQQGFTARKSLLKYDSVLADQRNAVYELRAHLLSGKARDFVLASAHEAISQWVAQNMPASDFTDNWPVAAMKQELATELGFDATALMRWVLVDELSAEEVGEKLMDSVSERLNVVELAEDAARSLALQTVDAAWTEQLTMLKELQDNSGLKGMAGQNVSASFHKEAFQLFQSFNQGISASLCRQILPVDALQQRAQLEQAQRAAREAADLGRALVAKAAEAQWIPRNAACPCGSGKRFKLCHGVLTPSKA